jgi:hypothetical protein
MVELLFVLLLLLVGVLMVGVRVGGVFFLWSVCVCVSVIGRKRSVGTCLV